MILQLTDPASIVAWWSTRPEQHWHYLEIFERQPQFKASIQIARNEIRRHTDFRAAFESQPARPTWDPALAALVA